MWVWALVGGLLLLPLLVLAVPVELAFAVERAEATSVRLRLKWLFGLIQRDLTGAKRAKAKPPRQPRPKPRRARRRGAFKAALAALRARGFLANVARLVRRVFRAVRVRHLEAHLRVGLGNPAETGWLLGMVYPLLALAPPAVRERLTIEPDFWRPTLQGYGRGEIRVVPLQILLIGLAFVAAPSSWRAFRAYRRARRS